MTKMLMNKKTSMLLATSSRTRTRTTLAWPRGNMETPVAARSLATMGRLARDHRVT